MAESEQHPSHGSDSPTTPPFKIPSFILNLLKPKSLASVTDSDGPKPAGVVSSYKETQSSSVFYPYNPHNNTEPLEFEAPEGSSGRTSNPFVHWPVYALGGFLVLKWAWARWNERNETGDKKKTTYDDDDDDDDDDQAPLQEDDHDHPS